MFSTQMTFGDIVGGRYVIVLFLPFFLAEDLAAQSRRLGSINIEYDCSVAGPIVKVFDTQKQPLPDVEIDFLLPSIGSPVSFENGGTAMVAKSNNLGRAPVTLKTVTDSVKTYPIWAIARQGDHRIQTGMDLSTVPVPLTISATPSEVTFPRSKRIDDGRIPSVLVRACGEGERVHDLEVLFQCPLSQSGPSCLLGPKKESATTVSTDKSGIAKPGSLITNSRTGTYSIEATVPSRSYLRTEIIATNSSICGRYCKASIVGASATIALFFLLRPPPAPPMRSATVQFGSPIITPP